MSVSSVGSGQSGQPVIEFAIYADRENDLDAAESATSQQALQISKEHPNLRIPIEESTRLYGGGLRTYDYIIQNGRVSDLTVTPARDMAGRAELANFGAWVLDDAQKNKAQKVGLCIVDHGAGNAGVCFTKEPDGSTSHLSVDNLAGAIGDSRAIHAQRHPEDKNRKVDIVVMHACFMLTLAVAIELANVGVDMLGATGETAIAPGIPATVAGSIAEYPNDPQAMAKSMVDTVMSTRYKLQNIVYGPVATFDVLDLTKMKPVEQDEINLNHCMIRAINHDRRIGRYLREDAALVMGMQADQPNANVPWHADRPALALYLAFAADTRLPFDVRVAALKAARDIAATILAHGETKGAVGFGADYRNSDGPTTSFPIYVNQIDPLSPEISETACSWAYRSGRNALIQDLLMPPVDTGSAAAAA